MKTYKGNYYFPTFQDARSYAEKHNFPTTRIIEYGRGWAIQLRIGGAYVGKTKVRRHKRKYHLYMWDDGKRRKKKPSVRRNYGY